MSQPLVRLQQLSFAYTDAVPLLDGVELVLPSGWTGLVGANGAGKSTLLRLLASSLPPTSGQVRLEPPGARVILCVQGTEALAPDVRAFADAADGTSRRLQGRLGLSPWELERWDTLSPGERRRWQLGAALASEPEVLLLDEPTNHLDDEARALLIGALRRFRGVGVVVSHDRALLESLTERTLRLHQGTARLWPGAYGQARREWELERADRHSQRQAAVLQRERAQGQLAQVRADHQAAVRQLSAGRRMKDRHDSDQRSIMAQFRAESASTALGKRVGVTRRLAEKAEVAIPAFEVDKTLGRSVFVDYERPATPCLFSLDLPVLEAGGAVLLRDVRLSVSREDRIHVQGANGAGKSTLLARLLESAHVPQSRILYLPQELSAKQAEGALIRVRSLPPELRGRTLSLLAALGADPQQVLHSASPSPGEARKLLLAMGLGGHACALVLDEPTHHLDLPSIERLEAALAHYPGALVLVSHDAAFAQRCASTRWILQGGAIRESSVG